MLQALRRQAASSTAHPKMLGWSCLEHRLHTWLLRLRQLACGILIMVRAGVAVEQAAAASLTGWH